ncbi:hypothetical protein BGZ63DRAFT_402666 [Mariannaea sp. PMI_226]|nr:hypothetical protein BGZ63DRAFT_402666 [Mariannaea sp. PMI_226]
MASMRGPRLQVGSSAWIAEERASALQITNSEVEEFTYSAQNEFDWLNEHMAGIFNENEVNFAETFKTPGKLRGKTPRTIRKAQLPEPRVPLSDVFGATPSSTANRFAQQLSKTQASRVAPGSPSPVKAASPRRIVFSPKPNPTQPATQDSGYYGSQDIGAVDVDLVGGDDISQLDEAIKSPTPALSKQSPTRNIPMDSPDKTFRTAKEDQTTRVLPAPSETIHSPQIETDEHSQSPENVATSPVSRHTPERPPSPVKTQLETNAEEHFETQADIMSPDGAQFASDGSSPIRSVMRKSSLNFASLPAREPLTAGKSRVSRTSHLDHHRTSYYNRHTGGKSLGNYAKQDAASEEGQEDEMDVDVDDFPVIPAQDAQGGHDVAMKHNKTYTQSLQDRINMLGKSQPNGNRPSKSLHSLTSHQQPTNASYAAQDSKSPSPKKPEPTTTTPGAFPEDDDDDWIDPPPVEPSLPQRPPLPKGKSADGMESLYSKVLPADSRTSVEEEARSPQRPMSTVQRPSPFAHGKAASVSVLPTLSSQQLDGSPLKKTASVSNPSLAAKEVPQSPLKSPSRTIRDSPLKQVKNKLSSIFKGSKGLLASSAAISAEGKSSMLSPSVTRLAMYPSVSAESLTQKTNVESQRMELDSPVAQRDASPTRAVAKRTRGSIEREKELKRREKEALLQAEQAEKLEKAREKEREKVRVFSKEQERIAAMEKQVASKKENENLASKETPKPTRTSPRKAKTQQQASSKAADQDADMVDAPATNPPPSVSRSVGPGYSVPRKEIRRPVKPGKEVQAKAKPTPTVIRVNTGSQHSQFYPSASGMSSSFQDTSIQSQQQLASKASKATLQPKTSMQSLKTSVSSTGRPKALELAAKKKEQEEREAQRRREAKAEFEKKRAAAQEEQKKQEQQRRQEAERQKQKEQKERELAEAKKNSQRQAAIDKAKQTRAPPPAVRSQPNGPVDSLVQDKPSTFQRDEAPARPPSRMNSGVFKFQEEGRPVNAVLSTASKAAGKRPLGQDSNETGPARMAPSYGGPHYQAKDAKRRRTSDDFADELDMENPPNIKGPPVRPSAGFKKDLQAKSIFQNAGYSNVPQSATRDLFKATVATQHTNQTKAAHPLDMAQISKGAIPFAPNPTPHGQSYKTPARPGAMSAMSAVKSVAKSAIRSSPRFQNGESIELPEIQTDDEDEDDYEGRSMVAAWADSPDLRRALMRQELMDPAPIFGPPAPLNMDEVFSKYMDKGRKFRKRTSSANWSGADRLTEEDIRKDLAARDKMRRDGGWTYELSRDVI